MKLSRSKSDWISGETPEFRAEIIRSAFSRAFLSCFSRLPRLQRLFQQTNTNSHEWKKRTLFRTQPRPRIDIEIFLLQYQKFEMDWTTQRTPPSILEKYKVRCFSTRFEFQEHSLKTNECVTGSTAVTVPSKTCPPLTLTLIIPSTSRKN